MAERSDEWPRVHSCLYDWCPEKRDECRRCDAVVAALRKATEDVTAGLRKELGNDVPQIARG